MVVPGEKVRVEHTSDIQLPPLTELCMKTAISSLLNGILSLRGPRALCSLGMSFPNTLHAVKTLPYDALAALMREEHGALSMGDK